MTRAIPAFLLALLLLVAGVIGAVAAQGAGRRKDDEQHEVLQAEMANKLKHSQSLLTGLAIEDFGVVADNAAALKRIGQETLAKVTPNLRYVKSSAEFVSLADELGRRAKEKDLDGATLSYIRLTLSCVECHKQLRDDHVLDAK